MANLQFTQDYNFIGQIAKKYAERYGEILRIDPFYENYLANPDFDTNQNEIVYIIEAGFDIVDTSLIGSFDMYFSDDPLDFHVVIADIVSVQPPNTYYQHTTVLTNRFVKAVRNATNIEYAYAMGYSIIFKENVFNVIP